MTLGHHSDDQIFHGEVDSSNASGDGVPFVLYLAGSTTPHVLGATEKLLIVGAAILNESAGTYGIYATTDSAGKRVMEAALSATSGVSRQMVVGRVLPPGVVPKLIASVSGNVRGFIEGIII